MALELSDVGGGAGTAAGSLTSDGSLHGPPAEDRRLVPRPVRGGPA